MNFDQKAVKFLANFYINGGKHWTHGPLGQKMPLPCQPKRNMQLVPTWHEMWPSWVQELPRGIRVCMGTFQELQPTCTYPLREWREQRPPVLTDLEIPGPTKYLVSDASMRESSPHPHYTIGRKPTAHEGGACSSWQTPWLQSKNLHLQKADFRRTMVPAGLGPCVGQPTTREKGSSPDTCDAPRRHILQNPRLPAFMSRLPAFRSWVL
ncbi:protein STPG3 [Rhynchocyon petersi]